MAHRRIVRSPADSFSSEELDLLLELKPAFEREFRERFGRDLRPDEPVFWSLSRSGKEPVPMTEDEIRESLDKYLDELEAALGLGYAVDGNSDLQDQFTYSDPVTNLTYEVFYDFDYDAGQAVVAYALLGEKKIRLTRGLRQRMTQAAYDKWLKEAIEDTIETVPAPEFAFKC